MGTNGQWRRENGTLMEGDRLPRPEREEEQEEQEGGELHKEAGRVAQLKEENEEEEDQEEGANDDAPFHPFVLPGESRAMMMFGHVGRESLTRCRPLLQTAAALVPSGSCLGPSTSCSTAPFPTAAPPSGSAGTC